LSSKSGFLEGHDWLIDAARAGFSHIAETALVDNPKDKLDKDNKYIPGLYDSLFLMLFFLKILMILLIYILLNR